MADPISLAALGTVGATLFGSTAATATTLGTAATVAGGVVSAYGAEATGASQQAMYNYQSGVAQVNARIAAQNAAYTQEAGGSAGYQKGLQVGQTVSQEKIAQSGSGLDVDSGSSAATRASTTNLGQYDQDLIATNYARKAYGYETESAVQVAQAGADITAGKESAEAGDIGAASSLLSAAGSVSSKWLQANSVFGKGTTT